MKVGVGEVFRIFRGGSDVAGFPRHSGHDRAEAICLALVSKPKGQD